MRQGVLRVIVVFLLALGTYTCGQQMALYLVWRHATTWADMARNYYLFGWCAALLVAFVLMASEARRQRQRETALKAKITAHEAHERDLLSAAAFALKRAKGESDV